MTLVEGLSRILPNEDTDVSKELEKFLKEKINILTDSQVKEVKKGKKEPSYSSDNTILKADKVLVAIGVNPNVENIGLNNLNIKMKKWFY